MPSAAMEKFQHAHESLGQVTEQLLKTFRQKVIEKEEALQAIPKPVRRDLPAQAHVLNRGNGGTVVFHTDGDYRSGKVACPHFLSLAWTLATVAAVALGGYPAEAAAPPERVTLDRDALVYSQMATEGLVVMQLIPGDVVEIEPADTEGEWCKVKEVEVWGKSGYALCKELGWRRPTAEAPRKATTPPEAKAPPSVSRPPAAPRATEKPAAKPMATVTEPELKGEKRYTVQVASLAVERNAVALKARLEQLGFRPIIHTMTVPITRHRVYGGEFERREEAEQAAQRLKVDGVPSKVTETEGGKFGPEVGSFVDLNEAIDLAHNLQRKNYAPKIVSKAVPTPVHAVRVGEYENRSEAVEVLEALKRQGFTPVIVGQ